MFSEATLVFLQELRHNNSRSWFEANRERYEALVREPALDFIDAMAPQMARIAPNFPAIPKKMGGSLMRVYRDTRFSRDKTPYKTNIGIQFRHVLGKDVHAPGYYVHISPDECFLGVGCWHPEADALGMIRDRIAAYPDKWFAARDAKQFSSAFRLEGDRLTRPPKGYATDHPAIEDLKRKDFIGISWLDQDAMVKEDLVACASACFAAAEPFQRFLCDALQVAY